MGRPRCDNEDRRPCPDKLRRLGKEHITADAVKCMAQDKFRLYYARGMKQRAGLLLGDAGTPSGLPGKQVRREFVSLDGWGLRVAIC